MPQVISSSFTQGPLEEDGRRWINESHLCDDGTTLTNTWLGSQDVTAVLAARAAEYNRQFAEKEAVNNLIQETKLPLTHYEFRKLFPSEAKGLIDEFNTNFSSHPGLTDQQKRDIRSGLEDFKASQYIKRPFEPTVILMLNIYKMLGFITDSDLQEILSNG